MSQLEALLSNQSNQLVKALDHLAFSYQKVQKLPSKSSELDNETLETWESFSARFSRVAEIFLIRYLKTRVLLEDRGFRGTLRDFLNQAEKMNLIDDAEQWMQVRELRNITAHEYNDQDLTGYFQKLLAEAPKLLAIRAVVTV